MFCPAAWKGRSLELPGMQPDLAVPFIAALHHGSAPPRQRKPVAEAPVPKDTRQGLSLKQAIQIDPAYADAYGALANVYATSGANYEATALELMQLRLMPSEGGFHNLLGNVLMYQGRFDEALVELRTAQSNEAFQWLERAYEDRKITQLKVEPYLDPLREDPRFLTLLKKAGLTR
jgi:tetratricopeptide (TPR) repeat protein